MKSVAGGALALILFVAAALIYLSTYVVDQRQFALPLRLGEPQAPKTEPGLYFKAPFIDNIIYLDKRILDLDTPSQEVIASDQKRLVVDSFARYRITDPLRFYQSLNSITGAELRLRNIVNSGVRRILGQSSFADVVKNKRAELMQRIRVEVNREGQGFGIEIVDVRIRRADLPEANSAAVFQRMQTERQREAAQFRAEGNERSALIRAEADRTAARLLGEATGKSEEIRGSADATRNRIFAEAFGKDPDFFAFYRSMQAYEQGLRQGDTRMVLSPTSDFFRYFSNPRGNIPAAPTAAPTAPAAP